MYRIHKEGRIIIPVSALILAVPAVVIALMMPGAGLLQIAAWVLLFSLLVLVVRFFRVPIRLTPQNDTDVYSSADGKVVVVEEVEEPEYFGGKRIQVSVFMSIYNVHINWTPLTGEVVYDRYHVGRFMPAWLPKSSTLNERNTFVIRTDRGQEILVRQIAGTVARRIAAYKHKGDRVKPGDQLGFIRFGSRVDIFLPLNSEIKVSLGQTVRGCETLLAILPD